jgi:hypothetical protein
VGYLRLRVTVRGWQLADQTAATVASDD